uniref:Histidine-containing phosphotransfer protein n=1 Tax=Wolffia australiana TaxID=161112 RepID=H6UGX3_WOLAU|nr:histidine-containing phosphotransfer protein [Wolffia australiana]
MAAAAIRDQLNGLVNSMFAEGLLDGQFNQLQMLQDETNPGFVAEVITLFCEDAERLIKELSTLLDQPVVDYFKVDAYVHQLKGSSASVGAQYIKLACVKLRQFCEAKNKEGCAHALNLIRHEYYRLKVKLEMMVQLERRIQAYEGQ